MAKKEPTGWITVNGKHVPIYEGESKQDAYNRAVARGNEDKKKADIARNKKEAEKASQKISSDEDDEKPPKRKGALWDDSSINDAIMYLRHHKDVAEKIFKSISSSDAGAVRKVVMNGWAEDFYRYDSDVAEQFLHAYEKVLDL